MKNFFSALSVFLAGLRIKLTQDRVTGEKIKLKFHNIFTFRPPKMAILLFSVIPFLVSASFTYTLLT